jgi:argininosuccinate synthase
MPGKRTADGKEKKEKLILAYSGGLDTSVILVWLVEKGFDVVCFCADVGQGDEDFDAIKAKALKCGASQCYIEDLRKEFVVEFVYPAVQCNAIYEGQYLLGTSIARPCITRAMVRVAHKEGAKYLGHGATGKGNDQVRFEMCALALDASLEMVAPWRDPEFLEKFKGRKDLLEYASEHGIHVDATPKAPYSVDANLYHNSYESGMLEDPMTSPLESMFILTNSPEDAPDEALEISIEFEKGLPVKVVDKSTKTIYTDPLESYLFLNKVAGENGVGRIDIVENRFVGIKSRGVYETPAGTVLRQAHLDIEGMTMDREVMRIRDLMTVEFSRLCYNGFWYGPEMELVLNSITFAQKHVTGTVHLKLYKGNCTVVGREALHALYSKDLASMDIEDGGNGLDYNPMDAQGFIRINAVRLRASAVREVTTGK